MADPFELVTFDGHNIGPATVYSFFLHEDDDLVVAADVELIARRGMWPLVGGTSRQARHVIIQSDGPDNDDAAAAGYRDSIDKWFDPGKNTDGPRYLVRYADDGTTLIRIPCYVTAKHFTGNASNKYVIELLSPQPFWEANTATTSSSNPATVTNNGNVAVPPIIALTTSNHVTNYPTTVSGVGNGGGLIGYPVVAALNDTDATDDTVFVYVNGNLVPTFVDNSGASDSRVWFLVDAGADGSNTTVDIIINTGAVNPLGGTLPDGGMDLATATNTSWAWDDFSVADHPARPGAWRYGVFAPGSSLAQGGSYEVVSEATGSVVVRATTADGYAMDANGIGLDVGSQAGTSNALTGLSRVTTSAGSANSTTAAVRYRVANSGMWVLAWSTTAAGTVTTSIDVDDAVQIAASVYGTNFSLTGGLVLTLSASGTFALALAHTPTVTVGVADDLDLYDGTYVVGGYTLTFDNLIVPDGTLTIDCGAKSITTSPDGPQYGDDSPSFSDPDRWAMLEPGSNTITDGITSSDTITHRGGYST